MKSGKVDDITSQSRLFGHFHLAAHELLELSILFEPTSIVFATGELLTMIAYPNVELSVQRLLRFGWKMGDVCFETDGGREWVVTGKRGRHWIVARGPSQSAAWWLAWRQANQLEQDRTVPSARKRKSLD